MTMQRLTAAEKTDKLRQNFARPEPVTLCKSCKHCTNTDYDFCRQFTQVGGENKAGYLIVLSCDGYQRNG
jgi:hypothetical protein